MGVLVRHSPTHPDLGPAGQSPTQKPQCHLREQGRLGALLGLSGGSGWLFGGSRRPRQESNRGCGPLHEPVAQSNPERGRERGRGSQTSDTTNAQANMDKEGRKEREGHLAPEVRVSLCKFSLNSIQFPCDSCCQDCCIGRGHGKKHIEHATVDDGTEARAALDRDLVDRRHLPRTKPNARPTLKLSTGVGSTPAVVAVERRHVGERGAHAPGLKLPRRAGALISSPPEGIGSSSSPPPEGSYRYGNRHGQHY